VVKLAIQKSDYMNNSGIWSAGGVVVRKNKIKIDVLLCERISENLIALPKGKPVKGENENETALREVEEETGIKVSIQKKIMEIFYSFYSANSKINKKVIFFLMEAVSGNINNHDTEFDKVYWEDINVAKEKLTYQGEKDVLEKVVELVKRSG
tara:strand:+ start:1334 stop:1792 length:459 start_codon:yes stop_codon:yes gene_type:complete